MRKMSRQEDDADRMPRKRLFCGDVSGDFFTQIGWSQDEVAQFIEDLDSPEREIASIHFENSTYSDVLGGLEFYKRYLFDCYVTDDKVKSRLTPENLTQFRGLKREDFEAHLCYTLGVSQPKNLSTRQKNTNDRAIETATVYSCDIESSGNCLFQKPVVEEERAPIQKAFCDDKILQVKFCTKTRNEKVKNTYRKILQDGIKVGLRHYDYLVHKEDKKSKKGKRILKQICYFVCTRSYALEDSLDLHFARFKSLEDCRLYLMHIHTVSSIALYNKRLQLALSKTLTANIDMSKVHIRLIDDIACTNEKGEVVRDINGKILIHTDGTGLISEDLARKCAGLHETAKDYPGLIQVRMFYQGMAMKGTLLTDKTLPPETVLYRPSMLKVDSDPSLSHLPSYNSLEICCTSHKPQVANLSRYIISLLFLGGVPESVFLEATHDAIAKACTPLRDFKSAVYLCMKYANDFMPLLMVLNEIPLDNSYLRHRLTNFIKQQFKSYAKGKVTLSDSFYLMGTADPTGTLKRNQVAILLENGPLYRNKVLVYKHPGMHPGDVHEFEATWNDELGRHIGRSKFIILFSTEGPRAVVDEIANSDLDGDMYWICTNEQVLKHFKASKPWISPDSKCVPQRKPSECTLDGLKNFQIDMFLKAAFHPSMAVPAAATSWLIKMDKYLSPSEQYMVEKKDLMRGMGQLVDLYYDALDSEKTGQKINVPDHLIEYKKPHFFEDEDKEKSKSYKGYRSCSILGKIYDIVKGEYEQMRNIKVTPEFYPQFTYPGYEGYINYWKVHYDGYRQEIAAQINRIDKLKKQGCEVDEDISSNIYKKYRELLYGGPNIWKGVRHPQDIYGGACAIYKLNYDHVAKTRAYSPEYTPSFKFAWEVAGDALCQLFPEEKMSVSPNMLTALGSKLYK